MNLIRLPICDKNIVRLPTRLKGRAQLTGRIVQTLLEYFEYELELCEVRKLELDEITVKAYKPWIFCLFQLDTR